MSWPFQLIVYFFLIIEANAQSGRLEDIKTYCLQNDPQNCYWNVWKKPASWVTPAMQFELGWWYCRSNHKDICVHLLTAYKHSNSEVISEIKNHLCLMKVEEYCVNRLNELKTETVSSNTEPSKEEYKTTGDHLAARVGYFKLEAQKVSSAKVKKKKKNTYFDKRKKSIYVDCTIKLGYQACLDYIIYYGQDPNIEQALSNIERQEKEQIENSCKHLHKREACERLVIKYGDKEASLLLRPKNPLASSHIIYGIVLVVVFLMLLLGFFVAKVKRDLDHVAAHQAKNTYRHAKERLEGILSKSANSADDD